MDLQFYIFLKPRKRIMFLLFGLLFLIPSIGANADNRAAVTMVSYEQTWLDSEGTIALKNNTSQEIHNISFRVTYLDMSGNPLDYEDFEIEENIASGMTKKIDIPAYEHDRHYHYYKTKDELNNPAFKINFQLKGFNTDNYDKDHDNGVRESSKVNAAATGILGVVCLLIVVSLFIALYVLVAVMAQKRNRSAAVWVLLSFFATPVLIIIILLVIGKSYNERIS